MILSKTLKRVTAYIRYVMFRDERGEIENGEHEYTINGVRYIAESAFISPEKDSTTLKERICRILLNEDLYLTSRNPGVTMTTKCVCSSAEKEEF